MIAAGGVVAVVVEKIVRVEEMLGHAHDNNNITVTPVRRST